MGKKNGQKLKSYGNLNRRNQNCSIGLKTNIHDDELFLKEIIVVSSNKKVNIFLFNE